jgi:hypothetical protein
MSKRKPTLKETIQDAFLEYTNDYLTISTFAEHKGLTWDEANDLIRLGRQLHERIVEENKQFMRDHFEIIHIGETNHVKQQ